ncbi:hypothetical protein WJX77_006826 [Trebouxia sp. C0004]
MQGTLSLAAWLPARTIYGYRGPALGLASQLAKRASYSTIREPPTPFRGLEHKQQEETFLYDTHTPMNLLQKGAIAVLSTAAAFRNPARADMVAALGETTGVTALQGMLRRMQDSVTGQQILRDRPRVTSEAVAHAWDLPEGTFGHAYAKFMGDRNFTAGDRPPVRFIDDIELAYVAARAREVHDFWHVLFGCHTNVFGELALKAVELVQTGMPMTALSVLGGQFRLKAQTRAELYQDFLPWALRAGFRSADLMCLYYEKHFEDDLEDLRRQWRIEIAPIQARKSKIQLQ